MKKVLIVLISIITISYGISFVQVSQGKQKLPTILGFTGVSVVSGSMEPEISVGDYTIIKKIKKEEVKKGDIITFEQNGVLVTHRVEKVVEDGMYSTKGDANNVVDSELVRFEDVVGITIVSIPKLGNLFMWLRTLPGLISILVVMLVFVMWPSKKTNKSNV